MNINDYEQKTVPRPEPTPESETYTVKEKDTLWKIAAKKCGGGSNWTKLYSANASEIEATANKYRNGKGSDNGHWIYPGTVLTIPA